jgi:membrane-bound metal-dependent hydrolase YbcI (DUF457 family)
MPSPLGHALGGFVAGWLVAGPASARAPGASPGKPGPVTWRARHPNLVRAAVFAAAGVLADVDLLAGFHSAYTHSVGAMGLVFAAVWLVAPAPRLPLSLAVAAAYGSHPLLDWLAEDTSAPLGIMLLWPFSHHYLHSGLDWFQAISRRYWLPGFWTYNLHGVLRELLLLGPLAALVTFVRAPSKRNRR